MVKSQTSTVLLKSKLALKHEYPVYVVLKMFPFGSSEPEKKIHNFCGQSSKPSPAGTSEEQEWHNIQFPS